MKSTTVALALLLGLSIVGCGGAPDAGEGSEPAVDETASVGENQQALGIATNLGGGSELSIETCPYPRKQVCHFECTDPVDKDDIFHCNLVCVMACTPF